LSYEYNTAMTGDPLISREKRSVAGSFTFSVDVSFLLLFRPVSGCCGSKMGAANARCADLSQRQPFVCRSASVP
jgi:hypothetical protein